MPRRQHTQQAEHCDRAFQLRLIHTECDYIGRTAPYEGVLTVVEFHLARSGRLNVIVGAQIAFPDFSGKIPVHPCLPKKPLPNATVQLFSSLPIHSTTGQGVQGLPMLMVQVALEATDIKLFV